MWIGSSEKDATKLPTKIIEGFLFGLALALSGEKHLRAKPLKGFGGISVVELIEMDRSGTYRLMYTTKMPGFVFVLHVFQKKSKQGIKTPKQEIELILQRFKRAQELYKELCL